MSENTEKEFELVRLENVPKEDFFPDAEAHTWHNRIFPGYINNEVKPGKGELRRSVLEPEIETHSFYGLKFGMNALICTVPTENNSTITHTFILLFPDDLMINGTEEIHARTTKKNGDQIDHAKLMHASKVLDQLGKYLDVEHHYTCHLLTESHSNSPFLSIPIEPSKQLPMALKNIRLALDGIETLYEQEDNTGKGPLGAMEIPEFVFDPKWCAKIKTDPGEERINAITSIAIDVFEEGKNVTFEDLAEFKRRLSEYYGKGRER